MIIKLRNTIPYYEGTVTLDGRVYTIRIKWNITTQKWYMDLINLEYRIYIRSVALLPGKDLSKPYGYSSLGSLYLIDGSGSKQDPTYEGLGDRWYLEYTSIAST
jgi:hypothetical protein